MDIMVLEIVVYVCLNKLFIASIFTIIEKKKWKLQMFLEAKNSHYLKLH